MTDDNLTSHDPPKVNASDFGYNKRIEILDFLRGIAIIYVVIFHFLFDLISCKSVEIAFFESSWFDALHNTFIGILIAVSGICTSFSRNIIKRGAILYFLGSLLTIASDIIVPDNVFVFGALSFFGIMMMFCGIISPFFSKIDWRISFFASLLLFLALIDFSEENGVIHLLVTDVAIELPSDRHYLYPLGIKYQGFYSSDYFPLIPNGFLYLAGAALSVPIKERRFPKRFYNKTKTPVINFIGRHSLEIYIVHQPIFILLMLLF